jgi:alpha-glucosidase
MPKLKWWQEGIIYQIYPLSFQDSNRDGKGDLPGIVSRLDYLEWLGVDAIWLSPVYPSPMADFGYDVSDYTDINPIFGSLADLDRLVAEAHRRGLRLLMDLVPNHTSSQHPWFLESRRSRDNAKRSWYIWKDGTADQRPNNWLSIFGGSAWEWDDHTGQYYYHAFLKEQPDLNWRNPEVQQAMLDAIRFWLERGVDGFRIDVIWHLIKDSLFRDNPANPDYTPDQSPYLSLLTTYSADRPEVHDVIKRIRDMVDAYDDAVLLGEIYLPVERAVQYYGAEGSGLHLPFNFQLIQLPWNASAISQAIEEYERVLPACGWPNWVLGNHDKPRVASRIGPAQVRVAAMLLLTLRGTPTIYYGEEIGMSNTEIRPEDVRDTREIRQPGRGRDPERTPMQWSSEPHGGFTVGMPWLPVNPNYTSVNVDVEYAQPASVLALYQRLIQLRRSGPALTRGSYRSIATPEGVLGYRREAEGRCFVIALNLTSRAQTVPLPGTSGRVILSTMLDVEAQPVDGSLSLRADEGMIVEV